MDINTEKYLDEYLEINNNYDVSVHDAALLVLASAIHDSAAALCYSINMDNRVPSIGEGLVMIAERGLADIAGAINNLEVHDD